MYFTVYLWFIKLLLRILLLLFLEKFGCRPVGQDLLDRIQKITGKEPHVMLRRGLFFAQR